MLHFSRAQRRFPPHELELLSVQRDLTEISQDVYFPNDTCAVRIRFRCFYFVHFGSCRVPFVFRGSTTFRESLFYILTSKIFY